MRKLRPVLIVVLILATGLAGRVCADPVINIETAHLAQDNFPGIGVIDYLNLDMNSIRFDMALNIAAPEDYAIIPGDSLVIEAYTLDPGATLLGPPRMYYWLEANSLFNDYRDPEWLSSDVIEGVPCLDEFGEIIPDRYAFDLPDEAFIFPGDVIQYYFEVEDDFLRLTQMPADISDFGDFSYDSTFSMDFTMRGLPTPLSLTPDDTPSVLMIDDNPRDQDDAIWLYTLNDLGFRRGLDYDLYRVLDPAAGMGNGIGGRATPDLLAGYATILYSSGIQSEFTLAEGNFDEDPSDDLSVLEGWLFMGNRSLLLSGDHLISDLDTRPMGGAFLASWMGVDYNDADIDGLIGGQLTPKVQMDFATSMFYSVFNWPLLGGSPIERHFDAATAIPPAQRELEYLDPSGASGVYGFAAGVLKIEMGSMSQVVTLPFDLAVVGTETMEKYFENTRSKVLDDILIYFGEMGSEPYEDVDPSACIVSGYPSGPVSVYSIPDRSGYGPANAFLSDGTQVDATITVTVNNYGGFGIPNIPAEDIWLDPQPVGSLVIPTGGMIADGPTDSDGVTTFSNALALGGWSDPASDVWINVGDVQLFTPMDYLFNGADLTGDLLVNLSDWSLFLSDYTGLYDYRSDYYWDGTLNLSDMILMSYTLDLKWPDIGTPIPTPGSTSPPTALIGLFADEAGTHQTFIMNDPGIVTAYLLLIPLTPTTVGGAAFELKYFPFDGDTTFVRYGFTAAGSAMYYNQTTDLYEMGLGVIDPPEFGEPVLLATIVYGAFDVGFSDREITPGAHPNYPGLVYGDGGGRLGYDMITSPAHFNPTGSANVVIIPVAGEEDAPWTLSGTRGGAPVTGSGPAGLTGLDPDTYTLTWGNLPGWSKPDPAVVTQFVPHEGTIVFNGVYELWLGAVEIVPDPVDFEAPWMLDRVGGEPQSGTGYALLTDMPMDSYTLTWGDVAGWQSPVPAVQTMDLDADEVTIVFNGTYEPWLGAVEIVPDPVDLEAPWVLDGAGGPHEEGTGYALFPDMPMDVYTLAWGEVADWQSPDPAVQVQNLDEDGETIVFTGVYEPSLGIVEIVPDPVDLEAPWVLDGAGGPHEEGTGYALFPDMPMDDYTLTWGDIEPWFTPEPAVEMISLTSAGETITFTGIYHTPVPQVFMVTDVPNDQGRHLRIVWDGCEYDQPGSELQVTGYSLYRRQDAYKGKIYEPPTVVTGPSTGPEKLLGWDYLATVPAHGDETYQYVALTLCDWTEEADCPTTFFMRVTTDDNFIYYDSATFSGQSIDNLVPGVPKSLMISYNAAANTLSWESANDPDVSHYRIYRCEWAGGEFPDFPDGEPYALEAGLSWTDPMGGKAGGAWGYFYFVTAVDFNGNVSEPTEAANTALAGAKDPSLPKIATLYPCYPNPFNPSTTISFALPDAAPVRLEIYDISGRRVRVLIDGEGREPGRHEIDWNGRSDSRATVAAGVYFCRLRAGDMDQTRQVTLVK